MGLATGDLRSYFSNEYVLTTRKRNMLKREISDLERTRDNAEQYKRKDLLPNLDIEINKKKGILELNTAPKLRPKTKDKFFARKKELEKELRDNLPTNKELWENDPRNLQKSVNKINHFEKHYAAKAEELKKINMALDPDNSTENSVEYLRRAG